MWQKLLLTLQLKQLKLVYLYFNPLTPRPAKTGCAARMFHVEDALSPTSPTRYFLPSKAVNCLGDI